MAEYPQFEVTRTFKELESAISQAAVSISA
jgi:hypothetical protein